MNAIADRALHVDAVVVKPADARGPALASSATPALVIAVSDSGGQPVSRLDESAFVLSAVAAQVAGATPHARTIAPAGVTEPLAGTYVIELDRDGIERLHGQLACIVDVRQLNAPASSHGRALVALSC